MPFLEYGLISPAVRPKVKVNNISEVFFLAETSQNERECVIRFVSLPHSVTCNKDKSIMLLRNKSEE